MNQIKQSEGDIQISNIAKQSVRSNLPNVARIITKMLSGLSSSRFSIGIFSHSAGEITAQIAIKWSLTCFISIGPPAPVTRLREIEKKLYRKVCQSWLINCIGLILSLSFIQRNLQEVAQRLRSEIHLYDVMMIDTITTYNTQNGTKCPCRGHFTWLEVCYIMHGIDLGA